MLDRLSGKKFLVAQIICLLLFDITTEFSVKYQYIYRKKWGIKFTFEVPDSENKKCRLHYYEKAENVIQRKLLCGMNNKAHSNCEFKCDEVIFTSKRHLLVNKIVYSLDIFGDKVEKRIFELPLDMVTLPEVEPDSLSDYNYLRIKLRSPKDVGKCWSTYQMNSFDSQKDSSGFYVYDFDVFLNSYIEIVQIDCEKGIMLSFKNPFENLKRFIYEQYQFWLVGDLSADKHQLSLIISNPTNEMCRFEFSNVEEPSDHRYNIKCGSNEGDFRNECYSICHQTTTIFFKEKIKSGLRVMVNSTYDRSQQINAFVLQKRIKISYNTKYNELNIDCVSTNVLDNTKYGLVVKTLLYRADYEASSTSIIMYHSPDDFKINLDERNLGIFSLKSNRLAVGRIFMLTAEHTTLHIYLLMSVVLSDLIPIQETVGLAVGRASSYVGGILVNPIVSNKYSQERLFCKVQLSHENLGQYFDVRCNDLYPCRGECTLEFFVTHVAENVKYDVKVQFLSIHKPIYFKSVQAICSSVHPKIEVSENKSILVGLELDFLHPQGPRCKWTLEEFSSDSYSIIQNCTAPSLHSSSLCKNLPICSNIIIEGNSLQFGKKYRLGLTIDGCHNTGYYEIDLNPLIKDKESVNDSFKKPASLIEEIKQSWKYWGIPLIILVFIGISSLLIIIIIIRNRREKIKRIKKMVLTGLNTPVSTDQYNLPRPT